MTDKSNPFNIIKHRGDPQKAEFEGVPIGRKSELFVSEWNAFVTCAPYDNHFIFEIPIIRKKTGMSDYMCTCGSAGVVAKPEKQATRLFVCLFHATYGYHSTTIVNKSDFDRKDLGGTVEIEGKGKKWLI